MSAWPIRGSTGGFAKRHPGAFCVTPAKAGAGRPKETTKMPKQYHVYILTTRKNTALYVGVTGDLPRRIMEHKTGAASAHTRKYSITKLVYAEAYGDINEAIHCEKCIKNWKRAWKVELIEGANPNWEEIAPW